MGCEKIKQAVEEFRRQGKPADLTQKDKEGRKCLLTGDLKDKIKAVVKEFSKSFRCCPPDVCCAALYARCGINAPRASMQRRYELLHAEKVNIKLKPLMTETNKLNRLSHVYKQIAPPSNNRQSVLRFDDHKDLVMIDESWMYFKHNDGKVYRMDDVEIEELPQCGHKSHIEKIMFLAVLARPRPELGFDGKICMVPVVEMRPAKRSSVNRPKGTMEMRNASMNEEAYHNLFTKGIPELGIKAVFDQIEEKMWWMKGKVLKIQQDGATPHTALNSVKDLEAAGSDDTSVPIEDRWTIKFVTQSPNSPDLNICDLGFFWSFKSRLRKKIAWSKDYQEMVRVVLEVFNEYPAETLDGIWGCLYNNYRSVLENDGGNQYKIAHNNGRKRARETGSSVDLELSRDLHNKVRRTLRL